MTKIMIGLGVIGGIAFGIALAATSVVVNAGITKVIVEDAINDAIFGNETEESTDVQNNN